MSEVQLCIQEINKLIKEDPESPTLGAKLFLLSHKLSQQSYADSFFQQEGLSCIYPLLKSGHDTIRRSTLKCFLNLMCHYSVISAVIQDDTLKDDVDIFHSLLNGLPRNKRFGEVHLIASSMNAISLLIQMCPNGFHLFRQAVAQVDEAVGQVDNAVGEDEKNEDTLDPYKNINDHVVDRQLYKEALRLLQLIVRNSIIVKADEPIDRLVKWGIVKNLKKVMNSEVETVVLTESEKILIEEILLPLGNSCNRVGWYIDTIKRQPTKKVIQSVIHSMDCTMSKDTILKIADDRLEDKLEEHLIEIHDNIEKEISRMRSSTQSLIRNSSLSLGSPSSTLSLHSPKYCGSPDLFRTGSCESSVITTTSTLQTITETGAVLNTSLAQDAKHESTPGFFFRTLTEYLKNLLGELKNGGGAPIKLDKINHSIELPGKERKRSGVNLMSAFKRNDKRKQQLHFLIDVVSESTSNILTLRNISALTKLSASEGQKLAECALWKIMDGLREDHPTQTCDAILKFIIKKPQDSIQKFLSYVYERSLPSSIHVLMYGDVAVDKFFTEKSQLGRTSVHNSIPPMFNPSFISSNLENKSHQEEARLCRINRDISSPLAKKSDAIARINAIDSQLHQTRLTLRRLEAEVTKLRSLVE